MMQPAPRGPFRLQAGVRLLLAAMALRLLLYVLLHRAGYFYGIPWDTFPRTHLAWLWAGEPYFALGYWPPLQFWLAGAVYAVLRPWVETSTILVPVAVNQAFFAGSLVVTYLATRELGGETAARWAAILAAIFPLDVFASYSGMAEPLYTAFILSVSYVVFRFPAVATDRQPAHLLAAGALAALAAAAHYIGWFMALFVMAWLAWTVTRGAVPRRRAHLVAGAASLMLCGLFPALWLLHNWRHWGDPLHFTIRATQWQAPLLGRASLGERLMIPPHTFLTSLSVLGAAGLAAAAVVILKWRLPRSASYLAPASFVLAMLWLATMGAFAAPDQEPRYLVVFGWVLIPYVAVAATRIWQRGGTWPRVAVALVLIAIGADSLRGIFSFTNSFGPPVREAAEQAGRWLRSRPGTARVVIEDVTYAENVIPVVAGYPDRFRHVETRQVRDHMTDPAAFLSGMAGDWLAIVKDGEFAAGAQAKGLQVDRVGDYFLIGDPGSAGLR